MPNFGDCAVLAANIAGNNHVNPKDAWVRAVVKIFPHSESCQKKGCPRSVFLGLCEEGFIRGVPKGHYTRSADNKRYAVDAVGALLKEPRLAGNKQQLWQRIPGHPTHENGQMEIVISLWKQNLLADR